MSAVKIFVGLRAVSGIRLFEMWGSGDLDISYYDFCANNFETIASLKVKNICAQLQKVTFGTSPSALVDETFDDMLDLLERGEDWSGAIAVPFDPMTHGPVPVGIVFHELEGTIDIYRHDVHALDDVPAPADATADIGPYRCVLRVAQRELRRFGEKFQSLAHMDIKGPNKHMFWEEAFLRRRNQKILDIPTPPPPPTLEEIRAKAEEKLARALERQRRTEAQLAAAEKNFVRLAELCADGESSDIVWAAAAAGLRRGDPDVLTFCVARGFHVEWDDLLKLIDGGFSEALRAVVVTQPQLIRTSAYDAVVPDLLCARGPKRIEILLAAGAKIPERVIERAIELKNREVLLALAPHEEQAQVAVRDLG